MNLEFQIGLNAILNYRRMSYEIWYALAEFVDNSTQSFFNNRDELIRAYEDEGAGSKLEVHITYEREPSQVLRIVDNAMGMEIDEIQRALQVATPPPINTGRCRYGMGLKTASCWIGNKWIIRTKKLGSTKEYMVAVDVNKIALGFPNPELTIRENQPTQTHYTIIEITEHNREFKGRTISKIKDYLRSMYRMDILQGILRLTYNGEELTWDSFESRILKNRHGELVKRAFEFSVYGKKVTGWAGVLAKGARADAGFSILHSNRVIKGWPDSWRPEKIFGNNRNDLLNQRLVGEISLDDFEVSHTKDNIQWYGDEQEQVERKLEEAIADILSAARRPWKDQEDSRGPSASEIDIALEEFKQELTSPEMIDQIEIAVDVPAQEAITESLSQIAKSIISTHPNLAVRVGSLDIQIYLSNDMSPNDPYVINEPSSENDRVIVIINQNHPYMSQVSGSSDFLNYLRHCTYDAIAEWQASKKAGRIDSDTVKVFKDRLLRVPFIMEQSMSQEFLDS